MVVLVHIKQNLVGVLLGQYKMLDCNRGAVKDASTGKLSRHHFLIENASKDMSIEQMLKSSRLI